MFKLRSASHRGGRNGQHKKFKFVKTLSAIAGEPRGTGKDSVEIYLLDADRIETRRSTCKIFRFGVGTVSLIGKPKVKRGDILEVHYLYAFPSRNSVRRNSSAFAPMFRTSNARPLQLQFKAEDK